MCHTISYEMHTMANDANKWPNELEIKKINSVKSVPASEVDGFHDNAFNNESEMERFLFQFVPIVGCRKTSSCT